MAKDEGVRAGVGITPGVVVCGAGIVAWMVLARRVRALERRMDGVVRKAELARRTADRVLQALAARAAASAAVTDAADLRCARDMVREMICEAEAAQRAYGLGAPLPG